MCLFRISLLFLPASIFCFSAFAAVGDHPLGYAYEEALLINSGFPDGITEAELRSLSLTDSKLRIAYAALMRAPFSVIVANGEPPELMAVLNDLKRRGDASTPLLLDMMQKNHNADLEHSIVLAVHEIGTIRMEPYLEYLRDMIRARPDEINARANEITARVFLERGTPEDVSMLHELAKKRPFLAPSLERAHEFERWKHPNRSKPNEATPTSATAASPPMPQPSVPKKAPETTPAASTPSEEPASSTPWSIIVVLIVAALGLLWLVLKKRK